MTSSSLHRNPSVSHQSILLSIRTFVKRWFYTGMAALMLAVSIAGFAPAMLQPAGRRGPVSPLAAAHGAVFFAWLVIVLIQSALIATHRVSWHRRLGLVSAFLLALMVPLGFLTTTVMVRRGFDLSGDQQIEPNPRAGFLDPMTGSIFNLVSLLLFPLLAIAALCYRRRPAIHKRLMFFANVELILASIVHLLGHIKMLTGPAVSACLAVFLVSMVGRDYLVEKRIHPLTAALSILLFVLLPIEGAMIGPSVTWHHLVSWLVK